MMWILFFCLQSLAAVSIKNPTQIDREQKWNLMEQKLIKEFPQAPALKMSTVNCDPYKLITDGLLSISEVQNLICKKTKTDSQQLNQQLRSLAVQAHRTPASIEEYANEFSYPRKDIQASANNLQSCASNPKDTGTHQGKHFISGDGGDKVELTGPVKNINGWFFLQSISQRAFRMLRIVQAAKIPFCDLEFSDVDSIVVKPALPSRNPEMTQALGDSAASKAAKQLFATLHGSCEAMTMLPARGTYENYNPYVFATKNIGPACNPSPLVPRYAQTQRNPTLTIGSTGIIENIDFTKTRATDCSSFVTSALAIAGLRIKANQETASQYFPNGNSLTTKQLKWMGRSQDDCLRAVKLDGLNAPLRPGDILVGSGHTWIFSEVDNDPFGFSSMTEADCNSPAKLHYAKAIILDSDSTLRGGGAHQTDARDGLPGEMGKIASLACHAHFERARGLSPNYLAEQLLTSPTDRVVLLRHRETPECIQAAKPRLETFNCVSSCPGL